MKVRLAIVTAGALILMACGSTSSEDSSTRISRSSRDVTSTTNSPSTTTTATANPRPAPNFGGTVTLQFTYQHADGFDLDPIDLSPQLLGGDHVRTPLDTSNWLVIGQCPPPGQLVPAGEPVRVGVLKIDEVPIGPMRANAVAGAYNQTTCDAQPSEATPTPTVRTKTGVMPDVVCLNLQDAQDSIQDAGVFFSKSVDGTGQGRSQILDSNWIVIAQKPRPGAPIGEGDPVLTAVKYGEPAPGC
jgi:hypothetical protein